MSALYSPLPSSEMPNRRASGNKLRRVRGSVGSRTPTARSPGRAPASRALRKDWQLVQEAVAGNFLAREELFATRATRLYRTAFSVLHNKEDAEDAVQNGLCSAFLNLRSFKGRSSFSTWLTRIVINSALMILRKNRNARELSIDATDETSVVLCINQIPIASRNPEQSFVESERKVMLNQEICNLRPGIRAVVEFGQLQELSMKETAQALGISVTAAKARLFHARAALRKSSTLRAISTAKAESQ